MKLIDFMDMQIEILDRCLKKDSIDQIVQIESNVKEICNRLINYSNESSEKLNNILNNINDKYASQYVTNETDFQHFKPIVNPLIGRIIDFYLIGVEDAYRKSNYELFKLFYNNLRDFFNLLTNSEKLPERVFGYRPPLTSLYINSLSAYSRFIRDSHRFSSSQYKGFYNPLIKSMIIYKIHFEIILNKNFYVGFFNDASQCFANSLKFSIINQNDIDTFELICSDLHNYSSDASRVANDLRANFFKDQDVRNISFYIHDEEYRDWKEKAIADNPVYLSAIEYLYKLSRLRDTIILTGAQLIRDQKYKFIYKLLFNRQPIGSNYTSAYEDFLSTDDYEFGKFLRHYHQFKYTKTPVLEENPLPQFLDVFVLAWIFRNYLWSETVAFNANLSPKQISSLTYNLKSLIDLIPSKKSILRSLLRDFDGRWFASKFEDFTHKLNAEYERLKNLETTKVETAKIGMSSINSFSELVIEKLNKMNGFVKLFSGDYNLKSNNANSENWREVNREILDKASFLPDDYVNKSGNAIEAYSSQVAHNTFSSIEYQIINILRVNCEVVSTSKSEMEKFLLNLDSENKIIASHNVHLGFELLRNSYKYESPESKLGYYKNHNNNEVNISMLSHISNAKVIFVLEDRKYLQSVLNKSELDIVFNPSPNSLNVEVTSRISVEFQLEKQVGTMYYLK